jgi:hypothetical protein
MIAKTLDDTVLVLRTCKADGTSHGGFKWPNEPGSTVTAPDWSDDAQCGSGLHGWLWGEGDWSLKHKGAILWQVVEVKASDVVTLSGKIKFPSCQIVSVHENWSDAMSVILSHDNCPLKNINYATGYSGHAAATGDSGHALTTGYSGHAAATGDYGHAAATGYSGHAAATGNYGHAAATGYYGHASTTGYSGHAAATGNSGHASAMGINAVAVAGVDGTAKSGETGAIAIFWHDGNRIRIAVGYVGEDGIKSDTWYCVKKGKLTELNN